MQIAVILLVFLVAISCSVKADEHDKCRHSDAVRLFGTKTLYEDARHALGRMDDDDLPKPFDDDSLKHEHRDLLKDNCRPTAFYFLGRHSARFPDGEDIDKYNANLRELIRRMKDTVPDRKQHSRDDGCLELRQEILKWTSKMQTKQDNLITQTGGQEERNIARRFKSLYPEFFDHRQTDIKIGVTQKIRTAQTASEFLKELDGFDLDQTCGSTPTNDPNKPDYNVDKVLGASCYKYLTDKYKMPILEFHKQCKKISGENDSHDPLVERVKDPKLRRRMADRVGEKLGLRNQAHGDKSEPIISVDMLDSIWSMCKFETAMQNSSIWCSLFEKKDVKALEYIEDVDTYVEDAYGPRANPRQSCPVVSDLVNSFQDVVKSVQADQSLRRRAHFYFSHATPIKNLLAAFKLFRDDKSFTPENVAEFESDLKVPKKRHWRSSLVSPFSANIAFVLYRCPSSSSSSGSKFKVLASVTEQPVKLGGCKKTVCNIEDFMNAYKDMLNCDLNLICKRS